MEINKFNINSNPDNSGKHLFFIVNVDWFFISHRLPIAKAARERGYNVTVLAGDTGRGKDIVDNDLNFIPIPLKRSSINPFRELLTLAYIIKLVLKYRPDVVHNVALKACSYGGIATRFLKNCITINAVSGLGYAFTAEKITMKQKLLAWFLRLGFHRRTKTIFQNTDDLELFKDLRIINSNYETCLIKGSGVDIDQRYRYVPAETKPDIIVLLAARMLYAKGVEEYCFAAKQVMQENPNTRFLLVGDTDEHNRNGIPRSTLSNWEKECGVEWLGFQSDMVSLYINSDIVVLPSYYREGLPKSLIEACSIGRPIVTTNSVGCRECVEEGTNGFLVPIKNVDVLADRILKLVKDPALRNKMGIASRKLAERDFSLDNVIEKTIALYS